MASVHKINKDSHYNNLYEAKDFNESLFNNKIKDSIYFNRIPSRLKKTFCISIILVFWDSAYL